MVTATSPLTAPPSAESEKSTPAPLNLYPALVLISAFLLFQTELILAKYILPWFGGAPAAWNACMLFFQMVLFAGYGYSDWVTRYQSRQRQSRLHLLLLAIASAALVVSLVWWGSPLTPDVRWKWRLTDSPVTHILVLLTATVGIPFFLLSTTGPLMQRWFHQAYPTKAPYRLYAISNLGSMLGLLSYPFALEWLLTVRKQAWVWTFLYALFLILCGVQAWQFGKHRDRFADNQGLVERETHPRSKRPARRDILFWIALSACASAMLLATTNLVCQDVAAIPFLWVVPLCIYLLSFAICFEKSYWYNRWVFLPLYIATVPLVMRFLPTGVVAEDVVRQVSAYFLVLFTVCMICNGELERRKPEAQRSTGFYLCIAGGGALGSAFVVLIAPFLFRGFYEYHVALLGCGLLVCALLLVDAAAPVSAESDAKVQRRRRLVLRGTAAASLLTLIAAGAYLQFHSEPPIRLQVRNFFGTKRVYDRDNVRYLHDGAIDHGGQSLLASSKLTPLTYYTSRSAIGILFNNYRALLGYDPHRALRIGAVGLGVGTMAAYNQPGDTIRYYELDPQVAELSTRADPLFTFLRDSPGTKEIVLGDGRLSLEAEAAAGHSQQYDILVIDAFSGDAIPVHLLTVEAMQLYLRHLRGPDSVIAVHISNRVLDLTPVLLGVSEKLKLGFAYSGNTMTGSWVFLSANRELMKNPILRTPFDWSGVDLVLWTDDYSNLLSVLKR